VYRDDRGETPVLEAVRQAEEALVRSRPPRPTVGPAGNAGFNAEMEKLVFGARHEASRLRSHQERADPGRLRRCASVPSSFAWPRPRAWCT
jgi:aspartate aminotransferase